MSILSKTVPINTDGDGADQTTVRLGPAIVHAIRLALGTLAQVDIEIVEEAVSKTILSVSDQESDAEWTPVQSATSGEESVLLAMPIVGRLQINVANADPNTVGELTLVYEN